MSDAPTVPMRVEVTTAKPPDSRQPPHVTLRITDDISGVVLADIDIEAWRWWDIITGGGRVLPGSHGPDLDRVGKVMLNDSVDVPGDVMNAALDSIPHGRDYLEARRDAGEAAAAAWAAGLPDAYRWDTLSGRQSNRGWHVTRRRWVDPDDPDAADRLARRAEYQVDK